MDDPEQAHAYACADFSEPHQAFLERFALCFPRHRPRQVLDLGCGAADITIRFARAYLDATLTGLDGSPAMLAYASEAVTRSGMGHRLKLNEARIPETDLPRHAFDTVISNSLLHHLHDPQMLWRSVSDYAAPGSVVFIMDLRRPDTRDRARELVEEYTATEPVILQRDFYNSLLAAFRTEEIITQLWQAGLSHFQVEAVGDRHVIIHGTFA